MIEKNIKTIAQRIQAYISIFEDFNIKEFLLKITKKHRQKPKMPASDRKARLRKKALKQIQMLARKKDQQKILEAVSEITRDFFRQYFGVRYAFTNEELSDEMEKRRIDPYIKKKIKTVLEKLSETKYYIDHSDAELQILIKDLKQIVQLID